MPDPGASMLRMSRDVHNNEGRRRRRSREEEVLTKFQLMLVAVLWVLKGTRRRHDTVHEVSDVSTAQHLDERNGVNMLVVLCRCRVGERKGRVSAVQLWCSETT